MGYKKSFSKKLKRSFFGSESVPTESCLSCLNMSAIMAFLVCCLAPFGQVLADMGSDVWAGVGLYNFYDHVSTILSNVTTANNTFNSLTTTIPFNLTDATPLYGDYSGMDNSILVMLGLLAFVFIFSVLGMFASSNIRSLITNFHSKQDMSDVDLERDSAPTPLGEYV